MTGNEKCYPHPHNKVGPCQTDEYDSTEKRLHISGIILAEMGSKNVTRPCLREFSPQLHDAAALCVQCIAWLAFHILICQYHPSMAPEKVELHLYDLSNGLAAQLSLQLTGVYEMTVIVISSSSRSICKKTKSA